MPLFQFSCLDGPLYTMLAQRRQTASLYYIGERPAVVLFVLLIRCTLGSNVLTWPIEAQLGFTGGHEICAHTWSHQCSHRLGNLGEAANTGYRFDDPIKRSPVRRDVLFQKDHQAGHWRVYSLHAVAVRSVTVLIHKLSSD